MRATCPLHRISCTFNERYLVTWYCSAQSTNIVCQIIQQVHAKHTASVCRWGSWAIYTVHSTLYRGACAAAGLARAGKPSLTYPPSCQPPSNQSWPLSVPHFRCSPLHPTPPPLSSFPLPVTPLPVVSGSVPCPSPRGRAATQPLRHRVPRTGKVCARFSLLLLLARWAGAPYL